MVEYNSTLPNKPSFMKGIARILDLFGSIDDTKKEKAVESNTPEILAKDWQAVGRDIIHATEVYEDTKDTKKKTK